MQLKRAFVVSILLLFSITIFTQQNNFRIYSIEQGLPQSTVFKIIQDQRGYLWIGTNGGGVCRFDGINFISFSKKDGLPGNIVRTLMEDSKGNLWIGTENGLAIYDGFEFVSITNDNGLSGSILLSLYEDKKQNIWAGTSDGGLNKFVSITDTFNIIHITKNDGLISNFIFDIQEDKSGNIWLAMLGGINIFNPDDTLKNIQYLIEGLNIPAKNIISIEMDKKGNFWCGSLNQGMFIIQNPDSENDSKIIIPKLLKNISNQTIWSILSDNSGNIWIATDKSGIYNILTDNIGQLNENNIKIYNQTNGLPDNQILSIYEDVEKNIWIGTNGSGLCQFLGDHFTHYTNAEGLPNNLIFDIDQDKQGNYWLASYGGGLAQMRLTNHKPEIKIFDQNDGLPDNFISSITFSSENILWIATASKGICKFQNNRFINYNETDGLINDNVYCIYSDKKGNIWCGTGGGISKFDGKNFINISEYDGLINNEVQTIIEDKKGNIWFGTLGGLAWTDGKLMTDYDETDGLTEKRIQSLVEDSQGNVWIGTFGGGLFKFNPNYETLPISFIADDKILSSNNIYSLIFETDTTLIVGTDKGFDKLYLNKDGRIDFVKNYDKSDGFIGIENNLNAIYRDFNNNIWFGTIKGLTSYDLDKEISNISPPRTHIVELKLFFESIDWGEKVDSLKPWFKIPADLRLPYSKNHLTFKFSGISLKNPYKLKYSYKLEGLDENWSPPSINKEASYPGLPPGKYTFMVKAENENGIWNSDPITFNFTINPPFWHRWWFYLSLSAIIILLIILYIKYREKQLKIENRILEEKVVERTKKIENQKLEIEEKNKYILDSIAYAKRIQDAVMPSKEDLDCVLNDYFIFFKPRDIVSGDFYWITQKENKTIVVAADCTGHGVPGAFMSMLGVAFLNDIVNKSKISSANKILNQLRNNVKQTLSQSGQDDKAKDGMDIALCIFDNDSKICQFAGAYNPLYLFRNGELIETKADKMPIGIHIIDNESFTNNEIKFKKGDTFYLFSDGFVDQFGGKKGKKFMTKPFKKLLQNIQTKSMTEQKKILDNTFNEWQGSLNQVDDILIIGIRI